VQEGFLESCKRKIAGFLWKGLLRKDKDARHAGSHAMAIYRAKIPCCRNSGMDPPVAASLSFKSVSRGLDWSQGLDSRPVSVLVLDNYGRSEIYNSAGARRALKQTVVNTQ
jgi:hypothetical protein